MGCGEPSGAGPTPRSGVAPRCQVRAGEKYRAVWPAGRGRKNFCVPTNLLEISAVGRPARVRHHGVASLHWTVYPNSREPHTAERRGPPVIATRSIADRHPATTPHRGFGV